MSAATSLMNTKQILEQRRRGNVGGGVLEATQNKGLDLSTCCKLANVNENGLLSDSVAMLEQNYTLNAFSLFHAPEKSRH